MVALPPVQDLLFCAKDLFDPAIVAIACRGSRMSDEPFSALNCEHLASRWRKGVLPVWQLRASKALVCRWRRFLGERV